VALVAPLLGIIFAFDAVNSERHDGTLPRLLSQPIHRDDVINGKFAAGLAVIGIVLVAMLAIVSGYGMFRLGIVPEPGEVFRLIAWTAATFVYVALWLAFGLLLSVAIRNTATAALVGFGTWLFLTLFGPLVLSFLAPIVAPISGATQEEVYSSAVFQDTITRLLPSNLYQEISVALLNPSATQVSAPATIGQAIQANQQIGTLLSLDQSLLIVWPQIVALVALTVICFGAAYVLFMRQEVRA
jgi:ABC-2 type transport system permease protein